MEWIWKAAGIAAAGSVLGLLLRKHAPETALLLAAALTGLLLSVGLDALRAVVRFARTAAELSGVSAPAVTTVLKCCAIAVVTKLTCAFCRDAGQEAAAAALELAGCAAAAYVTLPLLETVLDMIRSCI